MLPIIIHSSFLFEHIALNRIIFHFPLNNKLLPFSSCDAWGRRYSFTGLAGMLLVLREASSHMALCMSNTSSFGVHMYACIHVFLSFAMHTGPLHPYVYLSGYLRPRINWGIERVCIMIFVDRLRGHQPFSHAGYPPRFGTDRYHGANGY